MALLALWYHHSPEGLRFLLGRDVRMALVAAGVAVAYGLVRTRKRFVRRESHWRAVQRLLAGTAAATGLWFAVDWVLGEDWIFQLVENLPNPSENGIRYSMLMLAGWLGWSIAVSEALRRIAIVRHRNPVVQQFSE